MSTVCFVNHDMSVVGGDKTITVNLANELCKYHKVIIVSICNRRGTLAYKLDDSITYINLGVDNKARLREKMMQTMIPILKIYRKHKVKVSFLEGNYCGFIGCMARFFTGTKLVFCDHGSFASQADNQDIVTIRKMASKFCDKTIVLTQKSKEDYQAAFGLPDSKIDYIYNWIPSHLLEKERQYDADSKTILSVGRLDEEKGYDLLVKVAQEFLAKHPDWEWHIYGTGDLDEELKTWICDAGLEKQIIMKGLQTDLEDAFSHASILVLPSYREGLPIVLLEAIAYEIPAVSFDIITGPREILRDKENGYLIEPYDVKKMADQIEYLIEHPEERNRLSSNMKLDVDKFRKETILKQWLELIEKC